MLVTDVSGKIFFPSSGLKQSILLELFLYQPRPRKIPEERKLQVCRDGSLKYLTVPLFLVTEGKGLYLLQPRHNANYSQWVIYFGLNISLPFVCKLCRLHIKLKKNLGSMIFLDFAVVGRISCNLSDI